MVPRFFERLNKDHDSSYWSEIWNGLRLAHNSTESEFWVNIETFIFEHDIVMVENEFVMGQPLVPGHIKRIRRQLKDAALYADNISCYTAPGIMTSQSVCPGLGATETERLYWAYKGYLEGLNTD